MTTSPDSNYDIENIEYGDEDHFFYYMMPNIVNDIGLTVYERVLYTHIRRWARTKKVVKQSVRTIAKYCNMSPDSVIKAKEGLLQPRPELNGKPLIKISAYKDKFDNVCFKYILTNIWAENIARYEKGAEEPPEPQEKPHEILSEEAIRNIEQDKHEPYDISNEAIRNIEHKEESFKKRIPPLQNKLQDGKQTNPADILKLMSKRDLHDLIHCELFRCGIDDLGLEMRIVGRIMTFLPEDERPAKSSQSSILAAMTRGSSAIAKLEDELCTAFAMDYNFAGKYKQGRLQKLLQCVEAGETVEKFKYWWYNDPASWQGVKGQPPSLEDIFEKWPQAFLPESERPKSKNGKEPVQPVTMSTDGGAYV